jgi:hypothetical protein
MLPAKPPPRIELAEEGAPHAEPGAVLVPLAQASPTGRPAGISGGQIAPARARLQDPEDSIDDGAMADAGSPACARASRPWEMRFDLGPLRIGHPNAGSGHEHLRPVWYRSDRESTSVIYALYEVLKPSLVISIAARSSPVAAALEFDHNVALGPLRFGYSRSLLERGEHPIDQVMRGH